MMHSENGVYSPATRVIEPLSGRVKYREILPYNFGTLAYRPYVIAVKTNGDSDSNQFDLNSNPIEAYLTLPKVSMVMGIGTFFHHIKQGFEMYYKAIMLNPFFYEHFQEYYSDIESIQQDLMQRNYKIKDPYYFRTPTGNKTGFRSIGTAQKKAIQDYVRRYNISDQREAFSRAYFP